MVDAAILLEEGAFFGLPIRLWKIKLAIFFSFGESRRQPMLHRRADEVRLISAFVYGREVEVEAAAFDANARQVCASGESEAP